MAGSRPRNPDVVLIKVTGPPLSSRPERTRISCHAVPDVAACAAFRKESRMNFANATNLDRKSGVAQWRDLLFPLPLADQKSHRISRKDRAQSQPVFCHSD